MDINVQTGTTKAASGTSLVSLSFISAHKERAVLLLQVEGTPRDAKTLEEECVTILRSSLLGTEGEAWHRLDGSLKELNGLLKGLLVSETVLDVHAIVAIMDTSGLLHVSHAGRGEAYLIRGAAASQITEYSRGKPVTMFIHISSGQLEPGDVVLFSTQRLLRSFTPAQLVQITSRGDQMVDELALQLDAEREIAALAVLQIEGGRENVVRRRRLEDEEEQVSDQEKMEEEDDVRAARIRRASLPSRRGHGGRNQSRFALLSMEAIRPVAARAMTTLSGLLRSSAKVGAKVSKQGAHMGATVGRRGASRMMSAGSGMRMVQDRIADFLADLRHPERKRRAHLLLIAGVVASFLLIWFVVRLSTDSQRSKTKAELSGLVDQINMEIRTADNRRLTGDLDAANAILARAEERAKQVMDNETGLYRMEALNLLDRIHAKKEEINNITRLSPRVVVNLSSKNADISAQGLIGMADGKFIAYDRQNWYNILLNSVDVGKRINDADFVISGADFPRYKSQVFLTTGNSIIELIGNQPTSMKTEDPAGWVTGKDVGTYLRYLYVLSEKHIYKYERLSNRYSSPVQYDVNADITNSLGIAIDGSVYVLKTKGAVLKLLRGEAKPFSIRHAPDGVLADATKMFKVPDSNFYFLDPVHNRVVVATDGGTNGESSYVKQYVFEGDQLGKLQDLYVDPDEAHLYVMDEKRLYVVDLANR